MRPVPVPLATPQLEHALKARIAGFVSTLRANGFPIGVEEGLDALATAARIGVLERDAVRAGWRSLLCARVDEWRRFDALFDSYWLPANSKAWVQNDSSGAGRGAPQRSDSPQSGFAHSVFEMGEAGGAHADGDTAREGASRAALTEEVSFANLHNPAQVRELEILVRNFARRVRRLKLRREHAQAAEQRIDLRRTLRASLAYGGTPLRLAFRGPRRERPRLVLLLDASRSMSLYSFFYLRLARALTGAVADTHSFIFHTRLTPISEALDDPDPWRAQERLRLLSAGWAGGTLIGESLRDFNRSHASRVLHSRTVVIIASDGFDAGEPGMLGDELAKIAGRSRRIVWLNPLKGRTGYEPTARGMQEALPHIDLFETGHDVHSLRRLLPLLQEIL